MNKEVFRLRRLRQAALKVRALALVLNGGASADDLLARGALLTWRIARIATGRLRSHPYQSYQRDPSFFESGADSLAAIMVGTMASLRGQGRTAFLRELRAASRELDDTRALTLSADLSETLGRAQESMRALLGDAQAQATLECEAQSMADPQPKQPAEQSHLTPSPYLAL